MRTIVVSALVLLETLCDGRCADETKALTRMDRSRLQIGAYCLAPEYRDESHVRELADCGIDFLYGVPVTDRMLLDVFQKYGLGCIATGGVPFWHGMSGGDSGRMRALRPWSEYEKALASFCDHPAIWMLDYVDEPSALDFPYIGEVTRLLQAEVPTVIPYLNIYPNYACTSETTGSEQSCQLGTRTYREHVEAYARHVPLDYISFDFYLYAAKGEKEIAEFKVKYFDNLNVVSDVCRSTGKSLWFVPQVNSKHPELWLSENMLRFQAYSAMAYGAEVITWACWSVVERPQTRDIPGLHGWWHNNVLDAKGEKTEQYAKLKRINAEIHRLGRIYMRYRNVGTHLVGFGTSVRPRTNVGPMKDIHTSEGRELVVGEMKPRQGGSGCAVLVVPADDMFDEKNLRQELLFKSTRHVKAHCPQGDLPVERRPDGWLSVPIISNSAVMLETVD